MRRWLGIAILLVLMLSACATPSAPDGEAATVPPDTAVPATPVEEEGTEEAAPPTPSSGAPLLDPDAAPPRGAPREFSTDFSKHSVPYDEILSGGPPKDGIPAINRPQFESVEEADDWLEELEPVVLVEINGDARAYPIQILMWHEIVNDTVGDVPVAVTFCPLCNTAIAFERTVAGEEVAFGTTGRLRYSNLIMYDSATETWWQQATGEAIAGEHTGEQLTFVPATLIAWEDFKATHPEGRVLSQDTGFSRAYGNNPYGGYDDITESPFLYAGPDTPDTLPPMARVFTIERAGEAVAYPYDVMSEVRVVNDTVGGDPVVVMWMPGVASALDSGSVATGRDVGTVAAYDPAVEGQTLTFTFNGDAIVDEETGSTWNVLGQATSGELSGEELTPITGVNHFWFSWAAFRPETRVYRGEETQETGSDPQTGAEPEAEATPTPAAVTELEADVVITVFQGAEQLGSGELLLSELLAQGKPVVLHLWAGLCPICRNELPDVEAVYREYADEVTLVGLDAGPFTGLGNEADARALISELGLTFPNGTMPDATLLQTYRILGVPATLFFKPNGELHDQWNGALNQSQLGARIEALLNAEVAHE